jgi:hypothetical protein
MPLYTVTLSTLAGSDRPDRPEAARSGDAKPGAGVRPPSAKRGDFIRWRVTTKVEAASAHDALMNAEQSRPHDPDEIRGDGHAVTVWGTREDGETDFSRALAELQVQPELAQA